MSTKFLTANRALGFKKETTPGTGIALADIQMYYKFRDIKIAPEIDEVKSKIAVGDWSGVQVVKGKRKISMSAVIDLDWGGTSSAGAALAAPGAGGVALRAARWLDILEIVSMKRVTHTSGIVCGHSVIDDPQYGNVTGTFWAEEILEGVTPIALGYQMTGATLTACKIVGDVVGSAARLEFTATGVCNDIVQIANANIKYPGTTGNEFDLAVVKGQLGVDFLIDGKDITADTWELDFVPTSTLDISRKHTTGYGRSHVTDMNPVFKCDPYLAAIATNSVGADVHDLFTAYKNSGVSLPVVVDVGPYLKLSIPAVTLSKAYGDGERDRIATNPLEFTVGRKPGGTGFGIEILQGQKTLP